MTTSRESSWPEDEDAVVRWVRASLRPGDDVEVRGLDGIRISARLTGTDLEHLTVDATRAALTMRFLKGSARAVPVTDAAPAETSRRSGRAGILRIVAAPVHVQGFPITVHAQLQDAPIEWVEFARPVVEGRPESARSLEVADGGRGMHGSARASLRADDVGPLLIAVLKPALKSVGIRLRRLDLRVTQDGGDGVRIDGSARARWRVFGASAHGSARIGMSRDGVITVRDLRLGSANPLVAIGLKAARRAVRSQIGRTVDVNDALAADASAVRLHDVRISVDDEITAEARLS